MANPILGHQYIGGQRSAQGKASLQSLPAAGGEPHPVAFWQANEQEVDAAVAAADAAFQSYRSMPATERAGLLEAIAEEIDALGDDFIAEASLETALPAARLQGERGRTSNQMRLFAKVLRRGDFHGARIDRALPDRQPLPRPDLRQCKFGIGPVAVFGASNFPLAFSVAGGDTAAALAAGCPVVVKAHQGHLITSERVADAIERAVQRCGAPAGVFNMVYGGIETGGRLVQAPGIKAVGFTGSLKAGRALCDLAAARPEPIPVFAEMSSINPVILLPQALRIRGQKIANEMAASVNMGCGQFCTSPGLLLGVRSPEFSGFIGHLRQAMAAQAPQTMLNAGILENYRRGLQRLTRLPGIEVVVTADCSEQGAPHLFRADAALLLRHDSSLQEEVFGPSTVVVEFDSREQLLRYAAQMHGQLTITLIGEPDDLRASADLIQRFEQKAGRLLVNGYPTGVEVCDAMVHGGPYPATSDARGSSVGTLAIERFLRPVCYQNYPDELLPAALRNANPLGLLRLVDGEYTRTVLG
jgi:alpha-ketoglutaric semialdehyde dehydrogenase